MSDDAPTPPDHTAATQSDGLVARLDVIEQQPLADRAQAYTTLHAELSQLLESADTND